MNDQCHCLESIPRLRRSECAAQSLAAELERLDRLTVEERIKAALALRVKFSCLVPPLHKSRNR